MASQIHVRFQCTDHCMALLIVNWGLFGYNSYMTGLSKASLMFSLHQERKELCIFIIFYVMTFDSNKVLQKVMTVESNFSHCWKKVPSTR